VLVGSVNGLEGTAGLTPFVFQVRLTAAASKDTTYDVFTTDGTAKAGINYVAITAGDSSHGGTVTFVKGSAFATVTVYVIAGSLPVTPATARAYFTLNVADPSSPTVPLASGTGTITAQASAPSVRPAARSPALRSAVRFVTQIGDAHGRYVLVPFVKKGGRKPETVPSGR
jgi:hypothetical protein